MMECLTCHGKNLEGAKFCIMCGNQLYKECKNCSIKLPIIANFCHECGNKIVINTASLDIEKSAHIETEPASKKVKLIDSVFCLINSFLFCILIRDGFLKMNQKLK